MVLGYLLYEILDLGVNVIKISYNNSKALYYWWYGMHSEVERTEIQRIENLNRRLTDLENLLEPAY